MSRLICIVAFLWMTGLSMAQQVPFYNHYLINPFVYNPAQTGNSAYVNTSFVRNQRYSSFGSTAVNNYLTVDGAIMKDKAGLGLMVAHQTQGVQQQLMSSLSYAYRLKINDQNFFRIGFAAGILDNRIDYSELNAEQLNDPYLNDMRPTKPVFNLNVGILYQWKHLQIGVAVPQIAGNKVKYANQSDRGYYQLARHYMGTVQYDWLIKDKWKLQPNVLVRYMPNAPFQIDGGLQVMYRDQFWVSATYKSDYAVQFNAGMRLFDFLRVGYSYEWLTGKIGQYNTGMNHEIFLGFSFKAKKEKEIQVVEKEVEVKVVDETAMRERDSIQKLKSELEERLKKALAESQDLKERMKQDSLDRAQKQVESTPLVKKEPEPVAVQEEIPLAKGYQFIHLDQQDAPDGYYVISGVFSSKQNAEHVLAKCQEKYPESYLVINKTNNYYYVVILYTLNQELALSTYTEYKKKVTSKVWILNYRNNP